MNSRPLTPLPQLEDSIEVLTLGHFLIGQHLEALPDMSEISKPISSLQRWHLCQVVTCHLWQCWSQEYLTNLQQFAKWSRSSRNIKVGDIVSVRGQVSSPTKWPLTRIKQIYPGPDGKVSVVTLRTSKGKYTRPVVKIVPLVTQIDDSLRDNIGKAVRLFHWYVQA